MLSLRGWCWDWWCSIAGDMDSEIQCSPSKLAHDTQLGGTVGTLEGKDAIQRDNSGWRGGLCDS